MAQLNNLIVRGSTRLIGKTYVTSDNNTYDIGAELDGIVNTRNSIRDKMVALGISGASSTSTLSQCATALNAVSNSTASATSLNCGASATIPVGYVKSAITVTANSLSSQTSATAAAADILSSKTAWVNGSKLTGSMPSRTLGTDNAASMGKDSVGIYAFFPYGYYPQYSTTGNAYIYLTKGTTNLVGDAAAGDVLSGKTFTSINGVKVSGTMTNNGAGSTSRKLTGTTTSVDIAAGYWSSKNTISVDTLAAPTVSVTNAQQTISCKDKMMTGNITIPAVNYYYTSTAAPSATSGYNDGDVWLVTAS